MGWGPSVELLEDDEAIPDDVVSILCFQSKDQYGDPKLVQH